MDSQYKLLSELLSDQAAFITSLKTSLANYWGGIAPLPPSVYGPDHIQQIFIIFSPNNVLLILLGIGFVLIREQSD